MKTITLPWLWLLTLLTLLFGGSHFAVTALAPTDWSDETLVLSSGYPHYASMSDDGQQVVALLPYSGENDNSRHVVLVAKLGGVWQAPVVLANNGRYSDDAMQWLPQRTHPVISGDGQTVVYVGYTGETFAPYMVTRQANGTWSPPTLIPTGLPNVHYWLSLSRDGHTLALSDYDLWDTQHIYVLTRHGQSWSTPVRVTNSEGVISGGGMPSLSADGRRLVYLQNARATFTEQVAGVWQPPIQLTANQWSEYTVEFPQMSRDGRSIFYFLVKKEPTQTGYVVVAQDLYVLRRTAGVWGMPEKVTQTPTVPTLAYDGPAAANEQATRFIYTRPITEPDPFDPEVMTINKTSLEWAEWHETGWQQTVLVEATVYGDMNGWPLLTPKGQTLLLTGGKRQGENQMLYQAALWQKETAILPPVLPLPLRTTAVIPPTGGSLFSEIDQTSYSFGHNTFTQTVTITHDHEPVVPYVPTGWASLSGFRVTAVDTSGEFIQPNRPVSITVSYGELPPGPTIPGTHRLYGFNNAEHSWYPIPTAAVEDDAETRIMSGQLAYFSRFAILGETNQQFLPFISRP